MASGTPQVDQESPEVNQEPEKLRSRTTKSGGGGVVVRKRGGFKEKKTEAAGGGVEENKRGSGRLEGCSKKELSRGGLSKKFRARGANQQRRGGLKDVFTC